MRQILFSALFILFAVAPAQAIESFTVEDIRMDGLQRITEGTVLNYLPVKEGDTLTTRSAQDAIRALFGTGFFRDISLARDGNVLIVEVVERPAISELTIEGNKAIKTEELRNALGGIGLTEGEIFDQQKLEVIEGELTRQYYSRGKYSVEVTSDITPLERNRVSIDINIKEGETAKIKHINVVGNEVFDDDTLIDEFESSTTGWLSWYSDDDQYSREKLGGDLEKLRSYYLDRGYLDFSMESAQVSITPDKRKIAITANVSEGEEYVVTGTQISGETVVPKEELQELVEIETGQIFSRKQVEETADKITAVLGNVGYAFANVTPVPDIDSENREVSINFFVDPGNRVYVRRIEFFGNYKTRDEVLRREMRQFEGSWFSQAAVERSRVRLQRLGYFSEVNIETPEVPGTEDQVDIQVTVEERPAGSFVTGFGYSQSAGLIFSAQIQQRNFLGTGKFVTVGANASDFSKQFNTSYVNPYYTQDGVSRGFSFGYSTYDRRRANIADYTQDALRLGTTWGIPVSEVSNLRVGLSGDRTEITAGPNAPEDILDFLEQEGDQFDTVRVTTEYTRDSRNSYFNPDRGSLNRIGFEVSVPGSNIEYYKVNYKNEFYWPLNDTFTFSVGGDIGYGEGYGESEQLPFFENFFAGGPRSVRGYEANTLGPKDQFNNPIGGAVKVTGSFELLFPPPLLEDVADTRFAAFVDFGNIYRDFDAFDAGELRYSAGIGTTWQAPIGPISLSLAWPFNDQPGDRTEVVQFLFGNVF